LAATKRNLGITRGKFENALPVDRGGICQGRWEGKEDKAKNSYRFTRGSKTRSMERNQEKWEAQVDKFGQKGLGHETTSKTKKNGNRNQRNLGGPARHAGEEGFVKSTKNKPKGLPGPNRERGME